VNNLGWNAVTSVELTGYVSYYASPQVCLGQPFTVYSGWAYHDPYGVTHYFSGDVLSTGSLPVGCPTGPTTLSDVVAEDGSGYVIASITGPGGPSYRPQYLQDHRLGSQLYEPRANRRHLRVHSEFRRLLRIRQRVLAERLALHAVDLRHARLVLQSGRRRPGEHRDGIRLPESRHQHVV
jgi:hypothetical protein